MGLLDGGDKKMTRRDRLWGSFVGVALAAAVAACGGDADLCDAGELRDRLAKARPGDTVTIGACRVEGGSFVVPAGVTLAGKARADSVIAVPAGELGVTLTPGTPPARLVGLTVESDGRAGVIAIGAGEVEVQGVTVRATKGIALGVESATRAALTDVALSGPVTADNAASVPLDPTPAETATHGLVLVRVTDAQLSNVTTSGFARFGALVVEGNTSWTGGAASDNLATGLMIQAGVATLNGIEVCRTMQGVTLIPPYGLVISAGADVETNALTVCDGDGLGLIQSGARGRHLDLVASGNGDSAVWVQQSDSFEMSGTGTSLTGNKFGGVVIVDSANVSIADAQIDDSQLATRIFGEVGSVQVGDGVQLLRSSNAVVLENVTLRTNQRVGILIDLNGGSTSGVALTGVTVSGTGEQLGAIAQNGDVLPGWDSGVTREGDTAQNDSNLTSSLSVVGLVGPNSMPIGNDVAASGLLALTGPNS